MGFGVFFFLLWRGGLEGGGEDVMMLKVDERGGLKREGEVKCEVRRCEVRAMQ